MKIYTLILSVIITATLGANDTNVISVVSKYTELKNSLYAKKIEEKRNLMLQNRNSMEEIRNYRAMKLYASVRK